MRPSYSDIMRRRAGEDDAVLVHLDEADEPPAPEPSEGAPPRRRAVWWVGAAVIAAVVVAVGVANVAAARRAAEWRAALADTPWVLPQMSGPLTEAWRLDEGGSVMGETSTAVLLSGLDYTGIRAVDPATGRVVWEIPAEAGYCAPIPGVWWTTPGAAPPDADEQLVVCSQQESDGVTNRVTTFDARTGERLAETSWDGSALGTLMVGMDLVTVSEVAEGAVVVARSDLRTGEARWTFRGSSDLRERVFSDYWNFTYDDDVVFFDGPTDLVLAVDTGEQVATDSPPPAFEGWELRDGGRVVITGTGMGGDLGRLGGQVVEPDGSVRFEFLGWPWSTQFATSTVLVVQQVDEEASEATLRARLVGLDLTTGTELWSRPDDAESSPLVAINGVGVVTGGDGVTAIDLRTGVELWTHPTDTSVWFSQAAPTDGRVVLVPVRTQGLAEFVAVDLRSGEERWRMPAPAGLNQVFTSKGLVITDAGEEIVAYRS